jgi:arylsulfatase A-like enzyme
MPTWLQAAGIPVPDDVNGRSFWPVIAGEPYSPRTHIFTERNFHGHHRSRYDDTFVDKYDPQRAVHTDRFHYVRNVRPDARPRPWYRCEITGMELVGQKGRREFLPPEDRPRPPAELYDLRHDPWEQHNVAGRPEYADVERDLAARLDAWMRETDDPALRPGLPPPLQDPPLWPVRGKTAPVDHL